MSASVIPDRPSSWRQRSQAFVGSFESRAPGRGHRCGRHGALTHSRLLRVGRSSRGARVARVVGKDGHESIEPAWNGDAEQRDGDPTASTATRSVLRRPTSIRTNSERSFAGRSPSECRPGTESGRSRWVRARSVAVSRSSAYNRSWCRSAASMRSASSVGCERACSIGVDPARDDNVYPTVGRRRRAESKPARMRHHERPLAVLVGRDDHSLVYGINRMPTRHEEITDELCESRPVQFPEFQGERPGGDDSHRPSAEAFRWFASLLTTGQSHSADASGEPVCRGRANDSYSTDETGSENYDRCDSFPRSPGSRTHRRSCWRTATSGFGGTSTEPPPVPASRVGAARLRRPRSRLRAQRHTATVSPRDTTRPRSLRPRGTTGRRRRSGDDHLLRRGDPLRHDRLRLGSATAVSPLRYPVRRRGVSAGRRRSTCVLTVGIRAHERVRKGGSRRRF